MHEVYAETICRPGVESWPEICAANQAALESAALGIQARGKLRQHLVSVAAEYTAALARQSPELKIIGAAPLAEPSRERRDFLIMTGHQPVIYHSGIQYKNIMLEECLSRFGGWGVNVVMDADRGACGEFCYPCRDGSGLGVQSALWGGDNGGIFMLARPAAAAEIRPAFDAAAKALGGLGLARESERVMRVCELYQRLAGGAPAEVNTKIRRHFEGGPRYFEIPFSLFLKLPEVAAFLGRVIADFEGFTQSYNRTLRRFREEHRIRNAANPFPDLGREDSRVEMPFWVIDQRLKVRLPLYLEQRQGKIAFFAEAKEFMCLAQDQVRLCLGRTPEDLMIVPRGMVISLVLRLCAADIFVHGTGGGHYDQCTDAFMREYFGIEPPLFAVASATRYLFVEQARQYQRFAYLKQERRRIYFHTEKYLELECFKGAVGGQLRRLIYEKQDLIEAIKAGQEKRLSTAELTQRLKGVERELRQVVDAALDRELAGAPPDLEQKREVYLNREYPYFMFGR